MKFTPNYSDMPSDLSSTLSDNPSVFADGIWSVAKKEHLPHPVTKQWREDVHGELRNRGRGAQARLLEFINKRGIKCSSGHLSDILAGKYDTSDVVGPVHEFLGWADPLPPTASRDAGELVHGYQRLTQEQRERLSAGADAIQDMSGDEARRLLAEIFAPPKK